LADDHLRHVRADVRTLRRQVCRPAAETHPGAAGTCLPLQVPKDKNTVRAVAAYLPRWIAHVVRLQSVMPASAVHEPGPLPQ
jgi:hypothetical protein